jgi:hypothetical protein
MTQPLQMQIAELRADGPRRFSRWDARLFDAVVSGPADVLAEALRGQPDADGVLAGYLRLVQQGVGTGVVKQVAPGPAGWSNFLERLLVELVPARLPSVVGAKRLAVLVQVWNLGEGLLREPAWVDRYVNACSATLERLDQLEAFLVHTLEPVLAPPPPASWSGKTRVGVLDLRPVHAEFLPGRLRLAAPTVMCVEDRRRPELQIGVLLRRDRKSEPLGVVPGLGEYAEPGPLPEVSFADGGATVAAHAVPLPTFRRCQSFAVARAGYVVASAPDSQRLWVIESE